jgi:4-amino-4-deoxy-L-arabinose transferase-like glycosyltransferase
MIAHPPPLTLAQEVRASARRRVWTPGRLLPLAVVAAVLASGLDSPSAGTHPDERLYLSLANDMQLEGAWMTPALEGLPDYTKPPLLYWASAACMRVFGSHLWAARFPVALCAFLLALSAGRLARRFGGEPAFARAVLLVGTSLGVLRYGRLTMMDVPLALGVALGVEAAWVAADETRPRLLLGVGVAAGLSALLKGPVGPLLVFSIAAALLAMRSPALLRSGWCAASVATALVLGAPWFVAMVALHGMPFVTRFILVENFGKFAVPWTLGAEAWLLLVLLLLAMPWVLLVQWRGTPRALRLLCGVWMGAVLLVFSLPGLKQSHYVVPCLVPLLLLAAVPERPRAAGAKATAVLLGGVATLALLSMRVPFPVATRLGFCGAAVLLGLAAVAVWQLRPEAAAVGFAGACVLVVALVLPVLNPPPLPDSAWAAAGERPIVIWRQDPGLYELLSSKRVGRVNDAQEAREAVTAGAAAVVPFQDFAAFPLEVRAELEPLAHWERLRPRLSAGAVLQAVWSANPVPLQEEALLLVRERRP